MNIVRSSLLALLPLTLVLMTSAATQARPDTASLFIEATMTRATTTLEKILAANFMIINGNGYLQDKEHFIANLKNGKMRIDRITFAEVTSSHYGDATLVTGNIILRGTFKPRLAEGLQRASMVIERQGTEEKIILFQTTPVRDKAEKTAAEQKAGDAAR